MKKRSTKKRQSQKLDFQTLEPRQLLAGDLVGPHQVTGMLPTGTNLVQNGDFETAVSDGDNFYAQSEVENWEAKSETTTLNIFRYNDDYGNVLDLDSTIAEFDRVFQEVATQANRDYLVAFDFRNHPNTVEGASAGTNDFQVWWNGELVGTYRGGQQWQTGTVKVSSNSTSTSELMFTEIDEAGVAGDGLGALLDNIRIVQASEVAVSNGSFENADSATPFNRPFQVEGWQAAAPDAADRWIKVFPSNDNATATDGERYLNLDVTDSNRDIVFRNIDTVAGSSYYVTFDLRVDGDVSAESDELRVRWNDAWASTILADSQWQNYGLMLTADSAETNLAFLEPTLGDGSGPLIDNVRVFSILQNDIVLDANGSEAGTTGAATYNPGAGSQNIGGQITLEHPSGDRISSATITLNGVVDGNNELIAINVANIPLENGSPKIILNGYESATRQLQLAGVATVAEYQHVLRSLSYINAKDVVTVSQRSVSIQVANNDLPPIDSTATASINIDIETDQEVIDEAIIQKFIVDNNLNAQLVSDGLYVVIDEPGTGQNPTINSTVRVAYTGKFLTLNDQNKLVEGETFDSSSSDGISFPLTRVIRGWQLGIPEFKTGGHGKLLIPSRQAYGPLGSGSIPANEVLIFDVELKQIV